MLRVVELSIKPGTPPGNKLLRQVASGARRPTSKTNQEAEELSLRSTAMQVRPLLKRQTVTGNLRVTATAGQRHLPRFEQ